MGRRQGGRPARGGFTPFTADLGDIAGSGEELEITVRARDPKSGPQARGKQAVRYANHDCNYTRVTGIWQTVWLEPVPHVHLRRPPGSPPDLAGSAFHLELPLSGNRPGHRVRAVLSDAEGEVSRAEARADLDLAPAPAPARPRRPAPRVEPRGPAPVRPAVRTPGRRRRGRRQRRPATRACAPWACAARPSSSTAARSSSAWSSTRAGIETG
ncbi:hypothetical protein GCM10020295_79890 [Streptomyces cinereospinus]